MPFTNENKSSSPTWQKYTRRGTTPTIADLGEFDFTESVSEDGDPTLGEATIASFASSSIVFANESKSVSPTWTNENKS